MQENIGPDGSVIFFKKKTISLLSQNSFILKLSDGTPTNSVLTQAEFTHLPTQNTFTVFTTHLKAGSKWSDIRNQQTQHLATKLRTLKNYIIAGDFNAECNEEFYKILRKDLCLNSVFPAILGSEPLYTTWKKRKSFPQESKKVEDYIFFHPDTFSCRSTLDLPKVESIGDDLLPSSDYPSDHLSIVATFIFKSCSLRNNKDQIVDIPEKLL